LPINEETSVAAQSWILHTQIAEELVAQARYPVVICDRSVLDNYVYLLLAAGRQESLERLMESWIRSYDLLVHVPIVELLSPDGIRSADPAFQRAVDERLVRELRDRGLSAVDLDPNRRTDWLDQVEQAAWQRIRPAQLPLL
jgi:nicotinamide riboside kinase